MIWKSTPKSSSDDGFDESLREFAEKARQYRREAAMASTASATSPYYGIPSTHTYEDRATDYAPAKAKQADLDKANKKIALLEEKMKHMEETFAKTVKDLVESLTKEHDERTTTDEAALDDIPF